MAFVVRIKRRIANKAVHACFGAQQAVGVFAFDAQGGVVDAGDFAVVLLDDFHFEAFALGVAGVHSEQHAGPVFGFGAACACGDVHKAVVGVGGLVEHSLKFQIRHLLFQRGNVGNDGGKAVGIVFFHRHVNQLAVVGDAVFNVVQREHDAFQDFALFADFLRALGVVPKLGVFGQPDDFFQPFFFALVIHIYADVGVALG